MKYSIISRGDEYSNHVVNELHEKLKTINYIYNQNAPDIIFSVGGDGTMLKAVHRYLNQLNSVVFIGIHTGKLGFYTDYFHNEIDILIEKIKYNHYTDVRFPLLSASVCNDKNVCLQFYALNEITLINPYHTQHIDVFINDEYFESFQGTGICISTPTGSSAYNKSLGGALVHPNIKAFQLTEIGSINNNVYRTISSPLIFPNEHVITLKSKDFNSVTITVDHMHQDLKYYEYIKCTLSDYYVTFRQFKENDFWSRVRKAFL